MTKTIPLRVRVENSYATGDEFFHDLDVEVPAPEAGQDLDDWAQDHLLAFTGEGPAFAGIEALYEVTVTHSPDRPELAGITASAQG